MIVGGMVGSYAARRQYESMSAAQAQQSQIDEAQAQAAQAAKAAQAAQAQAVQAQAAHAASQGKDDLFERLEKIASLKQKGILTEEEFQKLKSSLLSKS